ncbi:uncharacterized protein LOC106168024 [Lingula anatina]|uniref:Uncharacterized protein LOC106168024 n=1 Tax=Lingula anatina TaxID=7574 RepID=A0A1S3IW36_LINAN|nr:uncharacterized protein LOC106168024 [Lingula anatina]|eukprot:XP_013402402.1 uncharacterized protein LOC106168024 [Lingula anatina]
MARLLRAPTFGLSKRTRTIVLACLVLCLCYVLFLYVSIPTPADVRRSYENNVNNFKSFAHQKYEGLKNKTMAAKDKINKNVQAHKELAEKALQISFGKNYSNVFQEKYEKLQDKAQQIKDHVNLVKEAVANKTYEKLNQYGVIPAIEHVKKKINATGRLQIDISESTAKQFISGISMMNKDNIVTIQRTDALNHTYNQYVVSMPPKTNSCKCVHVNCQCCRGIEVPKLRLDVSACVNFTYVSRLRVPQLNLTLLMDKAVKTGSLISAHDPPEVCMSTVYKAAEFCMEFYNSTLTVNKHDDHKTTFTGCVQFNLNLLSVWTLQFPMDCFKIPQDEPDHGVVLKQKHFLP